MVSFAEIVNLLYVFVAPMVLLASFELAYLIINLRETLKKGVFEEMYKIWITILVMIFIISATQLVYNYTGNTAIHQSGEILASVLFLATMFAIRQRMTSIEIIKKATEELEKALDKRTKELRKAKAEIENYAKNLEAMVDERTKELRKAVDELTNTQTALLNLMEDYEQANVELKKALNELKEIDRMKDEIISNVSHELRTPITIVKSSAELLLENAKDEGEKKILNMIIANMNRLNTIVGELLYFSQTPTLTPREIKKINVLEIINMVVNGLRHFAEEKNIKIEIEADKNLPEIEGSEEKIMTIFEHLINNAIKFNKRDGKVTIKAKYKPGDAFVLFSVADTGIGIPKDKRDKIFERFYQVDASTTRKYSGIGMGLSIVRHAVELHGGRIWFESRVNEGTTFYFTLPLKVERKYYVKLK